VVTPVDTPPLDPHRRRTALPGHDAAAAPVHAPPGSGADRSGYVVFMRPPYHQVLADVIIHYSWPRVFYAYDNAEGRLRPHAHTANRDKYLDNLLASQTARKALPPTVAKSGNGKMADCPSYL